LKKFSKGHFEGKITFWQLWGRALFGKQRHEFWLKAEEKGSQK
jgi:hypothetical protein